MRYRTSFILEQNVKASVSETHISTNITLEGQSHVDCFPDVKGSIHYEFVPLNNEQMKNRQPNFPTFKVLKISAEKKKYIYRIFSNLIRTLFTVSEG